MLSHGSKVDSCSTLVRVLSLRIASNRHQPAGRLNPGNHNNITKKDPISNQYEALHPRH